MQPDPVETGQPAGAWRQRGAAIGLPIGVAVLVIAAWEVAVEVTGVPAYVLPAPSAILEAFQTDGASLLHSAWVTLRITFLAFLLALSSGFALAVAFARSRLLELALAPYAVILQVTPVVAIAPLILIWLRDDVTLALIVLAWIVAFFPVLSSATLGLRSADPNLADLFRLHGASGWQRLWRLELPSALPFLLGGLKVAAGLALIGAVVAEFAAGSGDAAGLAWRIIEAGNRLQIAKMFAALVLLSALGTALYFGLAFLEHRLLRRWHASALGPQG